MRKRGKRQRGEGGRKETESEGERKEVRRVLGSLYPNTEFHTFTSRTLTVQPHSQAEQCAKCCLSVLVLFWF